MKTYIVSVDLYLVAKDPDEACDVTCEMLMAQLQERGGDALVDWRFQPNDYPHEVRKPPAWADRSPKPA